MIKIKDFAKAGLKFANKKAKDYLHALLVDEIRALRLVVG